MFTSRVGVNRDDALGQYACHKRRAGRYTSNVAGFARSDGIVVPLLRWMCCAKGVVCGPRIRVHLTLEVTAYATVHLVVRFELVDPRILVHVHSSADCPPSFDVVQREEHALITKVRVDRFGRHAGMRERVRCSAICPRGNTVFRANNERQGCMWGAHNRAVQRDSLLCDWGSGTGDRDRKCTHGEEENEPACRDEQ